ncbi:MAG: helix-turn-helix domain-containing protein [Sporomusaceae bacterium]|jgi:excisionase family DNA binding protein|nr:helix-turn-helix domain-containing protein [Sporomusaceae bacterium]
MKLLNIKELCAFLQIGKTTAYTLIHSKGFPKVKVGREWRFEEAALEKWVQEQINENTG